ncbi:MAG: hypothetical protein GY701_32015 [Sulfitobacter sp.]|nr:hypothetical protein [Sulfitobacter sp.]
MNQVDRTPTRTERVVLEAWLDIPTKGAEVLRRQLNPELRVYSSCDCGCGSIGFVHPEGATPAPVADGLYPVEATVLDEAGQSIGGLLLFVRSGLLHDIDAFSTAEHSISIPPLERVRWE